MRIFHVTSCFLLTIGLFACNADDLIENEGLRLEEEGELDQDFPRVQVLDESGAQVEPASVKLSEEDIADWAAILSDGEGDEASPLEDGAEYFKTSPALSSSCSIPSTVYNSVAYSEGSPTGKASCYGYAYFGSDNEADCYIKFKGAGKYNPYYYDDVNSCARSADLYYWGKLAAYYDSSGNAYLRMDNTWCNSSNCEDGFKIGH